MRRRWVIGGTALAVILGLYLNNSSALSPSLRGVPGVLAHRGIHQTFSSEGLTPNTCTARRIHGPTNAFLENTLTSMRASFAAGATALELDIHPTTDGEFAVFHDWRLECRTNGRGVTRRQSMAYLKTLDVGYGYTADEGRTFPFRGRGVGMMPTLGEVLQTFPGHQFLINIKSNDPTEADRLIAYLRARGVAADHNLWIFAEGRPGERLAQIAPNVRVMSKRGLRSCSMAYLAIGWSGHVPHACRGKFMAIPTNLAFLFWGWPNRLQQRMRQADVEIMLVRPVGAGGGVGIERTEDLDAVPPGFDGHVITDNVEVIGPAVRQRF
jgi:glycerophosphoryl diester phosphodiesterase